MTAPLVNGAPGAPAAPRGRQAVYGRRNVPLLILCAVATFAFVTLGVWQIERRAWKLDLIARVETRVHAAAVPAPGPVHWPQISAADDEYRHVSLTGRFLPGHDTYVRAVTDLGEGFWVLAPFSDARGFIVLVNRGFVSPDKRGDPEIAVAEGSDTAGVAGLLRMSEPKGGFLRANDPANDRWYSRDVAAIAKTRGIGPVAPYFIDEEGQSTPSAWPKGGLTVITFPNNHLVYAITWFALALLSIAGAVAVWRGRMD